MLHHEAVGPASPLVLIFFLVHRYKLTGETGSYRYMAPEVFRHEPYNTKVGSLASTCVYALGVAGISFLFICQSPCTLLLETLASEHMGT